MSLDVVNRDAWVLEPYCFCKDREWLTIENLRYVGGGGDGEEETGGVLKAIPGLTDEETALLAALLTALAIFLLLLLLLLCCLCPRGLCCCWRGGQCCGREKKTKTSEKKTLKAPSVSSGSDVNLTAVDMKIPRAWMDNYEGFSDSELTKRSRHRDAKLWEDRDRGKFGITNAGFYGDEHKDGGWFSTSDLDSVYDRSSVRETQGWSRKGWWGGWGAEGKTAGETMDEIYRGGTYDRKSAMTSSLTRYKSSSYSDIIEKLMTPHPVTVIRNRQPDDVSEGLYSVTNQRRDVVAGLEMGGQNQFVDALTKTSYEVTRSTPAGKTNGTMSLVDSSERAGPSTQTTPLPAYSSQSHASPSYAESNAATSHYSDVMREMRNFPRADDLVHGRQGNVITEMTSEYKKRVVEETEETTTL